MTQEFFFSIARLIFDALISLGGASLIESLIEFLRSISGAV